jgi:magnesium transporter
MEAVMSETSFYHISQAGKLSRVESVDTALAASKGEGFVWLNYSQPAKEELSRLIESLDLHPLSIEDCFDENQIPKIEDFPRNTFILFNAFSYSEGKLSIGEIDMFIGDNFLVTVGQRDSENRELLNGIERIVEMDISSLTIL